MPRIINVPPTNKFAIILKGERMRRNMSLEEMAEFLGTTKQVLSRYERGERNPKLITAALFAKKLGVPISFFENETDKLEVLPAEPEGEMEDSSARVIETLKKYQEIIELFDSIPAEKQQEAKNFLRFLSNSEGNE